MDDMNFDLEINPLYLQKIESGFNKLPEKVFEKAVGKAANKAMRITVKAARRNVPVETGQLKKSIGIRIKKYRQSGIVFAAVGPRKGYKDATTGRNPANYAHLVEYGTAPHKETSEGGFKIGNFFVGKTIDHPGARPKPFLRPALLKNKRHVVDTYGKEAGDGIEKEAAKLLKKG